jgi:transposase
VGELAIVEASQAEVVPMRGQQNPQVSMLAFIDLESRIPPDHPLRTIKHIADAALAELSPEYGHGRASL